MNEEEDVHQQTENVVGSAKVGAVVSELVVFNDDEAAEKGQDADPIDDGMDVGSVDFLPLRVGRLEKENCLGVEKDGGQIQELGRKKRVSQ